MKKINNKLTIWRIIISFTLHEYLIHNQPLSKRLNNMEPGPDFVVPDPCSKVSSNDNTNNISNQPTKHNIANKSIRADSRLLERGRNDDEEKIHINARVFQSTSWVHVVESELSWDIIIDMHVLGIFHWVYVFIKSIPPIEGCWKEATFSTTGNLLDIWGWILKCFLPPWLICHREKYF